ncbi:FecR family protein [Flammeovirga aprica]|uniref:DUF4974 domain-containing protein n=1 Tax=Flammeovirga aprica JL-4 TaxID=694437 RepID=A0A7X9NZP7_9BACT|nr:FecR domain-containing protein [Flammeovirga aprica]NME66896.1 DUF4974 domain-containing protein [Flammeovirga aprica JL-4]
MKEKDFLNIIDRYASEEANENEVKLVDHFFDGSQNTASKEWDKENTLTAKKKVQHKIHQEIGVRKTVPFYSNSVFKSVASIVIVGLLMGLYFSFQPKDIEQVVVQTAVGEQKKVILPDGSIVHLNNLSSLSYQSDFQTNRTLVLEGEAFFDVQRDTLHPFKVFTQKTITQVLGTSFNVKSYHETVVEVVVKTGKVNVRSKVNQHNSIDLLPQQMTQYYGEEQQLVKREIKGNEGLQWMNKVIVFDQTPIEKAIEELERWYNVKIQIADQGIKNCQLNGQYKVNKLEEILQGLAFMNNIQYQFQKNGVIVLKGKGCQSQ